MKRSQGITLVALVVTIIILIILAGVTIYFAMGENGIVTKARNSKQQYTKEEIKEKLSLKIDDIQIEKQGNANLSDLDELNLEGYDVSAGNIGRILIVTKDSEKYIFWIDANLNITEFDGNISIENSNNSNTTIEEFTPTISNINGTYFTIEANATSSESTIVAYKFFVNNEYKGIISANNLNKIDITGLELDTEYEVYVLALDDKGTTKKSTIVKQRTLDKLYLYKDGDECTLLTGGWNAIGILKNNTTAKAPTITMNNNSMNLYLLSSDRFQTGGAIPKNKIQYKNYKKMFIKYTATLGQYNASSGIWIQQNPDNVQHIESLCYTKAINSITTIEIDLSSIEEVNDIFISMQSAKDDGAAICNINQIWLEK